MTDAQEQALLPPQVMINAQYAKDISFESPNSPLEAANLKSAPKIDLNLDVKVNALPDESFEVALKINASAATEGKVLFVIELEYAGVFAIKNLSQEEQKEQILLIYCPSLLFPFARRIIADLTRDGGYQPLMINPIDFAALYLQQKQAQQGGTASEPTSATRN